MRDDVVGQRLLTPVAYLPGFQESRQAYRENRRTDQRRNGNRLPPIYRLANLVAIFDVNRLGQRGPTKLGWDLNAYAAAPKRSAPAFRSSTVTTWPTSTTPWPRPRTRTASSGDSTSPAPLPPTPDVLLIDEPTTGLDAGTATDVLAAVRRRLPYAVLVVAMHRTAGNPDLPRSASFTLSLPQRALEVRQNGSSPSSR